MVKQENLFSPENVTVVVDYSGDLLQTTRCGFCMLHSKAFAELLQRHVKALVKQFSHHNP